MLLVASRLQCSVARICTRTASDTSRCGSVGIASSRSRAEPSPDPVREIVRPNARLDDVRPWEVTKERSRAARTAPWAVFGKVPEASFWAHRASRGSLQIPLENRLGLLSGDGRRQA